MDDVKGHARSIITSGGGGRAASQPLPDFSQWGEVDVQPMRTIRRITAERMASTWATVPHVTQCDKADITELEKLRQKYAKKVEAAGGKLTITAIALKVIAAALKTFPQFNSSIDVRNDAIVMKKYVHVGVAVDTDRGLLVPVIRDVDRKNIVQLSVELAEFAAKTKSGKLSPAEMQGGSFTISNLGGIGGTYFTPIINAPEVAILGMSRSVTEPVWTGESFEPRLMMPLSLSYDHRVIDGADGIRFLRWVCEAFEQPFLLVARRVKSACRLQVGSWPPSFEPRCPSARCRLNHAYDPSQPQTRRDWRRSGRLRRRVLRRRPRHEGDAHRPRAEPGRRLRLPRLHPVEGTAARREAARRGQPRLGVGRHASASRRST